MSSPYSKELDALRQLKHIKMKNLTVLFFMVCITIPVFSQTQLDVQGKTSSDAHVANIKVNYSGATDVRGLNVYSAPNGENSLYGVGGEFFGGWRGVFGHSVVGIGVRGESRDSYGLRGYSINSNAIYGQSAGAIPSIYG